MAGKKISNLKKSTSKKTKSSKKKKQFNPCSNVNLFAGLSFSYPRSIEEKDEKVSYDPSQTTVVDEKIAGKCDSNLQNIPDHKISRSTNLESATVVDESNLIFSTKLKVKNSSNHIVTALIKYYNKNEKIPFFKFNLPETPYERINTGKVKRTFTVNKIYLDSLKNKSKEKCLDGKERLERTFDFRSLVKLWDDRTK
ncbi:hypothetical protein P3W45_000327 [Vairimorpha bombi]|jgi:hypothetical protein